MLSGIFLTRLRQLLRHAALQIVFDATPPRTDWNLALFGSLARKVQSPDIPRDEALLLVQTFEESAQGWFWSTDASGCVVYISENVAEKLGTTATKLVGERFSDIFVSEEDGSGRKNLPFLLTKRSAFDDVTLMPVGDNATHFWVASGRPQFGRSGEYVGFRGSAIDTTSQRRSSARASRLSDYDALTELPNRRKMEEFLDKFLDGAVHHRRPCAVMLIDLDRFKQVNDTLGHPAGDTLLKQVAGRLVRIVGDKERVFRLGGDEFQVILPNWDSRDQIEALASDIIHGLSQPYSVEESRCIIGASIGIAVGPEDGTSRVGLMRNADLALYASKSDGRGRSKFFSTDLLASAERKRALEEDLRDVLVRNELQLVYQPLVHCQSNRITGVEALMRWEHPIEGLISPSVFIPIAEEAGLVGRLGDWALRKACEDAARWPGNLRVAVNVSPAQFSDGTLPHTIISALANSGLSPERLELEITEGVFLGDTVAVSNMFDTLKKIGVRLALDDFGTGYSSLGYLRSAPFDKIKIDQTFVREATLPGSRNSAIIAAIVALAEALGMDTTAEGIEYLDQLALIRRLGVSHVQGWVYSKALSCEDLLVRLEDGNWAIEPNGPAMQRSNRQSMFRKAGVLHGNIYRSGTIRNLSGTGAYIEGINEIPAQSLIIVDLGEGQLSFATVVRAEEGHIGVRFDQPLVDDGSGTLCTRRRISAYSLATLELPKPGEPDRVLANVGPEEGLAQLGRRIGLVPPNIGNDLVAVTNLPAAATFRDLSREYLQSLAGDEGALAAAQEAMVQHFLPRFGQRVANGSGWKDVSSFIATLDAAHSPGLSQEDIQHLRKQAARMWSLAVDMQLLGMEEAPEGIEQIFGRRSQTYAPISGEECRQLLLASRSSPNRQLKFIMALLMLTGARTSEILSMRWSDVNLEEATWHITLPNGNGRRCHELTTAALEMLRDLPRLGECPFVLPNLATRKPYQSLTKSWDVVKQRADLPHLELDDLRDCSFREDYWKEELAPALKATES